MKTKDLIYTGGFAVVYMIVGMIFSVILGFIPILSLYGLQILVGITCSTVYLMFVMKTKKFGAITLFALLLGILNGASGHIYTLFFALPIGLVADYICKIGKYNSKRMYYISYVFFNLITVPPYLNYVLAKEATLQMCFEYYGQDYADAIELLLSSYLIPIQCVLALIGGVLGAIFADKIMKKHFKKAGVV